MTITKKPITTSYDPWEAYEDMKQFGQLTLSNVEFTTTTLCNMRCAHCAVGYSLSNQDPETLDMNLILQRLDEIEHLRTLSITGGEPMLSKKSVENTVLPLMKYAHERGVRTQMNSNLTIDLKRYEPIIPYLDVLHISHNWGTVDEFIHTGFARMDRKPSEAQRGALFQKMIDNSRALSEAGIMVSAETMLNKKTLPHMERIHREVVHDMNCARHEIHPMYPSSFAESLETLSLEETREAIKHLLDIRDQNTWMLFGTLPFYACSTSEKDRALLQRLYSEKNVTVRNDPDGRSRLNVNVFTGDVIVTDFNNTPPLGNIKQDTLPEVFNKWVTTEDAKSVNCHCHAVSCLGPNLLVKEMYYSGADFTKRSALLTK
ncbi:radical SAM/CxCxxxxC motif protein YfkAB [Jeotgalibacillus terrae]|uniref:Radical SAM/CxCxxxxC motif protein YfkAB n=1 Tax=Jeotgalibacillus terrae TaxID=587735 RepID=A0ABW5ZGD6_9BACL|nr:radical SAM/CxCxxxxC motif protein YfkAB [Jeotgalibacillus terrae]MBM7580709.1 radical SAM/CxCxxxxC motif protein YfkAB [Jeotgalibacillus terrae]